MLEVYEKAQQAKKCFILQVTSKRNNISEYMLEPRGELEETYKLKFAQNGRPLFVTGPHDDAKKIIKQLEETAGAGNYDYAAPFF